MRFPAVLAGLLLFVLISPPAAACAGSPTPQEEKPQEEAAQAEPPKPLVVPEAEKNRKNPVAADKGSLQRGRGLFSTQCVWCHGPKGDGKGEVALADNLPTPDFTDAARQKKRTDGELFYILTHGHEAMPGQGARLREKQKWDLINFIRSLAPTAKPGALKLD